MNTAGDHSIVFHISMDTTREYNEVNRKFFIELNSLNWLKFSLLRPTTATNEKKISTQNLKLLMSFEKISIQNFPPFCFVILSMKTRLGVNFVNILHACFSYESLCTAFFYLRFNFVIFWPQNIGKKAAHKTLMKLTRDYKSLKRRSSQILILSLRLFWG